MSKKNSVLQETGKTGGDKTFRLYGSEHFSRAASKGRRNVEKKDPGFYKRLAASGLHAREVKRQLMIANQLGESFTPSIMETFGRLLSGRG